MLKRIYYFIWILLHLLYLLGRELIEWVHLVWNQCSRGLSSCWPHRSPLADCANIVKCTQVLKKHPQHIAFLVTPEEADSSQVGILQKLKFLMTRSRKENSPRKKHRLDVSVLSRFVAWSWAANIPVISLYDYHGEIKELKEELEYSIQDEILNNLWTVEKVRPNCQLPKVVFHEVDDKNIPITNRITNGKLNFKSVDTIHVFLVSYDDGKYRIVETAKRISIESLEWRSQYGVARPLVTEAQLDNYLSLSNFVGSSIASDPDILVISGNLKSTLGFLPWNIRLSEMYWVPKLPLVQSSHFLNVLETYSGCHQRFGT